MAYSVSTRYREIAYSGGAIYKCHLTIDGITISPKLISKIDISDPIIDTSSEIFHIGSFISKQIIIKFKNLSDLGLNITSGMNVDLSIGMNVDGTEENVPIGKFIVDELAENYQETCEITCLDYAVKFKTNIDYSPCFTDGKASVATILQYICDYVGVELDEDYDKTNDNVYVGSYDANVSGKQWISYIAEIKGCNAKISRDGKLYLLPLKRTSETSINAKKSKSFDLGERYEIIEVVYDDGVTGRYSAKSSSSIPSNLTTENNENLIQENGGDILLEYSQANTLYIRQDNPFINGEVKYDSVIPFTIPQVIGKSVIEDRQHIINQLFENFKNVVIYNLKTENYGDLSLDSYDIIDYTIGDNIYPTLHNSNLTYEMNVASTVESKIPNKYQEETTNMIGENQETIRYKKVQATLDTINNEIVLKATADGKIAQVKVGANAEEGSTFDVRADNVNFDAGTYSINADKINFQGKTFNLTTEDIAINSTYFSVDKNGNVNANSLNSNNATITGGNIYLKGQYSTPKLIIENESDPNEKISLSPRESYFYNRDGTTKLSILQNALGSSELRITSGNYLNLIDATGINVLRSTGSTYTGTTIYDDEIETPNLVVTGSKNRVVDIGDKQVLLNAYETTTPYFGDIGSNKTDENGYCKIEIEEIFSKTIENDDYKVFIQECGDGNLYVEKKQSYFEVKGTPNLNFDWELKAIQKGYKDVRLKEYDRRK